MKKIGILTLGSALVAGFLGQLVTGLMRMEPNWQKNLLRVLDLLNLFGGQFLYILYGLALAGAAVGLILWAKSAGGRALVLALPGIVFLGLFALIQVATGFLYRGLFITLSLFGRNQEMYRLMVYRLPVVICQLICVGLIVTMSGFLSRLRALGKGIAITSIVFWGFGLLFLLLVLIFEMFDLGRDLVFFWFSTLSFPLILTATATLFPKDGEGA